MKYAWHFVGAKLRDGRPVPADGEELVHTGDLVICRSGLHYGHTPFDALCHAPGAVLCYVKCEGIGEEQHDKGVCRKRTIVKRMDLTALMRRYACDQALAVLPANAPAVVREYLETADESLRIKARDAAWDATRDAAWDAAWGAARDAARDAAWYAARDAAWDAVLDAAWYAARDAAWDAARDAAWDAAWDAARDAARQEFNRRVYAAFGINQE